VTSIRKDRPQPEPDSVIEVYKRDVDVTLIRENLKLTPEERILKLVELQRFAEELRRAGQGLNRRSAEQADSG
jgi:hypothetical protein